VRTLTYYAMEVPLSVAFSPDGLLVAAACIDPLPGVVLWHVSDGRLALAIPQGASFEVDFSPDGSLITGALESTIIKLLRVSDGALVRTLIGHTDYVLSVAFSPNGRLLVSSGLDNTIRLWSVSDGGYYGHMTKRQLVSGMFSFHRTGNCLRMGGLMGCLCWHVIRLRGGARAM
jgi:WD40 repeat protein